MPRNWDEHYAQSQDLDLTPSSLLAEVSELVPPGRALDLACGSGRNALWQAWAGRSWLWIDHPRRFGSSANKLLRPG